MSPRVVVTGVGLACALGDDPDAVFDRILAGEHGTRPWPDLAAEGFPVTIAHRVAASFAPACRGRGLAVHAVAGALADADADPADLAAAGIFVGSTMGESAGFEAVDGDLDDASAHTFGTELARHFGVRGPRRTFGTACAAGNYAIGTAARAIAAGRLDVAVAGGVEPFSRITMLGFARLRAMAPERCRPFDRDRRGMQLGEGAAFLLLESSDRAARRGAPVRAAVGGLGLSGDAHHATAPRPDGSGVAAAMRGALAATGIGPADVGWVNAHGTGTPQSDAAEAVAIEAVFGTAGPPVSSLKGAVGHCLGAATAVEAALSVVALQRRMLPPTVGLVEQDAALPIDVLTAARPAPTLRWVMNCGYAFGGLNSALLLGAT
ncbi:beta-ketoacyl-[acyl-carrier-protein] synthase family protein [soil metagenome]